MTCGSRWSRVAAVWAVASFGVTGLPRGAQAVDGVIEISQAGVLAGGFTAGDAPGYPLTIAASGSYRLTGDLHAVGVAGATPSIEIVAPARDVAIDLNGFSFDGGGSCSANAGAGASCLFSGLPNGIVSSTNAQVVIRNGAIRGFRSAIFINSASAAAIEDLRLTEHTNSGVAVSDGIPAAVRRVVASITAGRGIDAGSAGSVFDSVADHNANAGIRAAEVSGSRASANGSTGIDAAFTGARVHESRAFGNAAGGISVAAGALVTGSSAHGNATGIQAGSGAAVVSSAIRDNTGFGLSAAADATYAGCTLTGNNGGANNAQVSGGIQLGTNFCGTDTVCP